jgi:hypothetical protein
MINGGRDMIAANAWKNGIAKIANSTSPKTLIENAWTK